MSRYHHRSMSIRATCGALAAGFAMTAPIPSQAIPVRGPIPWDFIGCTFSGTSTLSFPISSLRMKLLGKTPGSLADWVSKTSNGAASLSSGTLHGYYKVSQTAVQAEATENIGRGPVQTSCINAAANGAGATAFTSRNGRGLSVITFPTFDGYGGVGEAFDGTAATVSEIAHELGHGLGLNHSWSNDVKETTPNQHGDYDNQWDNMSSADVFTAAGSQGTYDAGPGLDAYHLDFLGWLPRSRTVTFLSDGVTKKKVTLAALNHPEVSGNLLVRIPIDQRNPLHYMTVEYVTPDGYYSGIPKALVEINEVNDIGTVLAREGLTGPQSSYYTTILQRQVASNPAGGGGTPMTIYNGRLFTIKVESLNGKQATVEITDRAVTQEQAENVYGPNTCTQGYVWRTADDFDYVCVAPNVRAANLADNAAAESRHLPGSKTCRNGYVWRKAFATDDVCVVPSDRAQAQQDNANTGSRYVISLSSNT